MKETIKEELTKFRGLNKFGYPEYHSYIYIRNKK